MGSLRSDESLRQRYHSLRQIRGLYPLMNENRLRDLEKGAHTTGRSYQR